MDIRLTFDDVVDTYERARPSYPSELFDALFAQLPPQPRVLEIGPGTGQATVDLLKRGAQVTAVEFGPNLAARLQEKFSGDDQLTVLNSSFEEALVAPHSFDAVTVATAYHWVEHTAQIERPLEVMRSGGVLGMIDLIQPESPTDLGYFDRVQEIYDRYHGARSSFMHSTYETAEPPVAQRLRDSGRYASVETIRVPWDQTYTSDAYRDLLNTHSGTQMMPEPSRTNMVDELVAVIDDEFEGVVTRPLVATLTLARAAR